MKFNDLLELMPRGDTNGHVLKNVADASFIEGARPEFVAPTLTCREDAAAPSPHVLVVSASGAVGKTTLARELAHAKNGLFWDLAKAPPVGGDALAGMLSRVFGGPGVGKVYAALTKGEFVIVIDSLDEARVKVNEAAFTAFLAGVAEVAKESATGAIALFARTQHAETAWLVLADKVPSTLYTIDRFDRPNAELYIERRMNLDTAAANAMESHKQTFEEARDLIFDELETAAQTGNFAKRQPQEFLGYAPVLDAVAVLLRKETNFSVLTQEMKRNRAGQASTGSNPAALLLKIVEEILKREREGKIAPQIREALAQEAGSLGWTAWDQLYSDNEQCDRLVALTTGQGRRTSVHGAALPAQLSSRYEEQIEPLLREHPLLIDGRRPANVVFEAYLHAYALTKGPEGLRRHVEEILAGPDHKPSPLLRDFYFSMAEATEENKPLVKAAHVGALYAAVLAGESGDTNIRLLIEGGDPEDEDHEPQVSAELAIYPMKGDATEVGEPSSIEFAIDAPPEATVLFHRYLRDAAITLPCEVRLHAVNGEFELGPNVAIRSGKLSLACDSLVVGAHSTARPNDLGRDSSVVLETLAFESAFHQRPAVYSNLQVSWPGAEAFPWSDYAATEPDLTTIESDQRLKLAYRRFRRIVMTLRSHSKGSLARLRDKIEHRRTLQGPMGEALLRRLVDDKILKLEGQFYHWGPDEAAALVGTSWLDLRAMKTSALLVGYLRDFVESNPDLVS